MIKKFTSTFFIFWLAGCGASMSQKECQTVNWYEKGIADGTAGDDFRNIDNYRLDCSEVSIVPNEALYYAGYHKGIISFCTYGNGYKAGRRGGQAIGCPDETDYLTGWKAGIKEFTEVRERREIEQLTRPGNNEVSHPGGNAGQTAP